MQKVKYFKRHRMELPLLQLPVPPELPAGFRWLPWDDFTAGNARGGEVSKLPPARRLAGVSQFGDARFRLSGTHVGHPLPRGVLPAGDVAHRRAGRLRRHGSGAARRPAATAESRTSVWCPSVGASGSGGRS